jgi:RND family efflux transporter MFP subunit
VFRIKIGDQAEITTDVYPGVKFYGRVETISAKGDDAHTYPVEIGLSNNTKNPLKAGMFGRVSFVSTVQSAALVIPRDALVGSVKNPQVYVMENGRAFLRKIVIGQEVSTNLTIINGLKEGETVIVSGQNNLTDNSRVSVIKQQ